MSGPLPKLLGVAAAVAVLGGVVLWSSSLAQRLESALPGFVIEQLDAPAQAKPGELNPNGGATVTFIVREGDTAESIGRRLEAAGLVRSALSFRILARWSGLDATLRAGEYRLQPTMRVSEILDVLQEGRPRSKMFTVPEGWRAAEIADALEREFGISRQDFLNLVASGEFSNPFLAGRPRGTSLEGYLFPDTYRLDSGMGAREVIQMMLDNFQRQVVPAFERSSPPQSLSLYQVVTLASIVEREARVPTERPLIAGVFWNRLSRGMPLAADPTIQYAVIGSSPGRRQDGYWPKELSVEDLKIDSPYNTYQQPGLPLGPIANPGLAAIQATLAPTTTDYLYFVAGDDGTHSFARTFEEHQANISRLRR